MREDRKKTDFQTKGRQDRFAGSVLGLAVGDALGAPVEGMRRVELLTKHGELRDYVYNTGYYTDDTQ